MSRCYLVRWEIDIEADSVEEAAAEAFKYANRQSTDATVFTVHDPMDQTLIKTVDVALLNDEVKS